jgi:hypothetical protein
LIELALRDQGFVAKTSNITLDGSVTAPVKSAKTEIDVFHLHGFWRESATLHRPQQLMAPRPQLQQSLQRHLDGTHLVVMAYSGWDDIFTAAIANCLIDPGFRGTVSWCFYNSNPQLAEIENKALLDKFGPGIVQGKIAFFCGIDCHVFFDELNGGLRVPRVGFTAVDTSPLPGWEIINVERLNSVSPLTPGEAVRFFDGAVPTLRHASSRLIPRLSHAHALAARVAANVGSGPGMQLLRAAGGEGKSTVLLQAAAMAALAGEWSILYRPATDAGMNPDVVANLDPAKKWLIVADDAEDLIEDLWSAADKLHQAERSRDVFFLLASRDTDWRLSGADTKGWSTRLNKLEDLTLGRLSDADAGLLVDAWSAQGEDGLRALTKAPTREMQISKLMRAARMQNVPRDEGSFFGALLETRFGAAGLVDHILPLLEPLRRRRVEGGTASLYDAMLYVASCHAIGMPGLDKPVLATLVGIKPWQIPSGILQSLGMEIGIAESRQYALTRHKRVAEAIVEVAALRFGTDLGTVWRRLVKAMVAYGHTTIVGPTYGMIVHAGGRLKRDLPHALDANLRADIGVEAAQAAMEVLPEWCSTIVGLARALRAAGFPSDASELLQNKLSHIKNTVDKSKNVRGYFYEWSNCHGNVGGRQSHVRSVWLGCFSLSDSIPVNVTLKDIKITCAGLGVALAELAQGDVVGIYAKGRRAVTELGKRTHPDLKTAGYFDNYERELDRAGTPKPLNLEEAIMWLAEVAQYVWQEVDQTVLRNLKNDGQITFKYLEQMLKKA